MLAVAAMLLPGCAHAQINTDRMMLVGRNALYFDDYVLAIQYFNQVINAKPYLYEPYFYRAVAKLSLEDFRGAELDCNSSIERNPFVVNSYQVRGLAKVYQQMYVEAVQDFRKGLSLDPENRSIRHNLILSLARNGDMKEALAAVDTLLMSWPKYAEGMAMKSDLLWDNGDSIQSLEWIDRAIEQDRFNSDLLVHRSVLKARLDMFDEALPDLDRAIYLDPGNVQAYMNRAMVHYERDSLNSALADYDMALRIDPANVNGHYNRGSLRAQVGDDNRAIDDFDFVIDAEPDNMMAVFNRGVLRNNTGDFSGAEQDISRVLEEYPDFILGYQLRSDVRERLGLSELAYQDAMVVLREQNRRFNRAMGYDTGSDSDADDEASDSKTRSSKDRNVRNYRKIIVDDELENSTGFSSEYRGRVQNRNVEVSYLASFRLTYFDNENPTSRRVFTSPLLASFNSVGHPIRDVRFELGNQALDIDRINYLFDDIETRAASIAQNPASVEDLLCRALDFSLLQDFQSALDDLDAAMEVNADNWMAWFLKAQILSMRMDVEKNESDRRDTRLQTLQLSEYRQVIQSLDKVIELAPELAFAYYNRGTFYAMSDDLHAALVDLDKAVELDPQLAQAWYNRAVVLVLLGRTDQAVDDMSRAGELGIVGAYNIIKRFSKTE